MKVKSLVIEAIQNKEGRNIKELLMFFGDSAQITFRLHLGGDVTIWYKKNEFPMYNDDYIVKRLDNTYEIVPKNEFEHYFELDK